MFSSSLPTFYPWCSFEFADLLDRSFRQPDSFEPAVRVRRSSERSERKAVVHGVPEVLLAAQVTFGSLPRCVSEQKLNLLQFAATRVTQLRAGPAQIMGCDVLQPHALAALPYDAPHQIL
jgi:hypothetical protein